jgi:hypothetical protein
MPLPERNKAYSFRITLLDTLNPGRIKKTPTIAAGDFKVSLDNGTPTNLITLPTETPIGSGCITIPLSAGEMAADKILVIWSDPQFEWGDGSLFFDAPQRNLLDFDRSDIYTLIVNAGSMNQLTESYAADGVAPTRDQLMFMTWAALSQFVIDSNLIRAKRLDGTTDAMVFTMNDPTAPTQRIRTS